MCLNLLTARLLDTGPRFNARESPYKKWVVQAPGVEIGRVTRETLESQRPR